MATTSPDPIGTEARPRARGAATGSPRSTIRSGRGAPLPLAAVVAAVWAATLSYAPILALSTVGSIGSGSAPAGVARLAAAGWLLAHGVPVQTPTDRVTLVPLALAMLAAWRLTRAGVHASRAIGGHRSRSAYRAVAAGFAVAIVYAVLGWAAATLAGTADVVVSAPRAAASLGAVALACATFGALGHSRAGRVMASRTPAALAGAVRTGVGAAAIVIAAGAAAAGAALAIRGGDAAEMLGSYRAGVLGQAGITALCLAYLPNLAVWGAAYLIGPGFSIGVDTIVSPSEVLLGPVPALPIMAALPAGPLAGVGPALLGVPLLAGVCAGALLSRWTRVNTWPSLGGAAILAGPVAGGLLQLASLAAAGALGSGRLTDMGSVDWRIGLVSTAVVTVGVVAGAAISRILSPRPARR